MTLLEVTDLKVHFYTRNGVVKAVDGVSFSVDRGEILGIVGESGSGKSVACYSLLGLVPQPPGCIESGSACFDGVDLLQCSEKQLRRIRGNDIALIFQDPMTSLNPYLTVGEQLIEPLIYHRQLSRSEARRQAVELLQEVRISEPEKRFDSYPHEFSGGMRQRVMIAMALISEPKLLIADEPTTALDVTVQAQIVHLIRDLQTRRDIAVIFISHDLAVVSELAHRVAVMHRGHIVEQGITQAVFQHSQHPYTQQLVTSIPRGGKTEPSHLESAALIDVKSLHTWFRDYRAKRGDQAHIKAVDDVTFTIRRGEILGLVGESGSGKSTLGRSLLQLAPVTNGSVRFDGMELTEFSRRDMKPLRRRMQMIFQDPYASLNPRMTVFDTLAEPLLLHRLAHRKNVTSQVLSLMDEVGLAHGAVRKYPHEFSGGQRQRIAIGRALATRPEFVVADEPVSALDVTIQAQILDLLLELVARHNLTMLFISHDLSVVRRLCDRVLVMYQGKIVESGATEQVYTRPSHSYTETLLASLPSAIPLATL